jgi:hypothetical protein
MAARNHAITIALGQAASSSFHAKRPTATESLSCEGDS